MSKASTLAQVIFSNNDYSPYREWVQDMMEHLQEEGELVYKIWLSAVAESLDVHTLKAYLRYNGFVVEEDNKLLVVSVA